MFISSLLLLPLTGLIIIFGTLSFNGKSIYCKLIAFSISIGNLIICLIICIFLDYSCNFFQFVKEQYNLSYFYLYLGIDGISLYFVLLTTFIMPIAFISNWNSITVNLNPYLIIMLLLETFLLAVFLVLDIVLFYIFFESILPPLFLLIGLFGSSNKVRASFYFFLYTLLGSLFLLLSILTMSSIIGTSDLDALFKSNLSYLSQILLFFCIFLAFAVKTPVYGLNTWLLKAHVESPLGGSVVLAAIVLKLSLYGVMRLILPILAKVCLNLTYIVYIIGVLTVIYANFSTLRTTDIKEFIAYSSVGHASTYFMSVFSNVVQGIEGAILLGLAHGFVSSGLFICTGGSLYDRTGTRNISIYRGIAQMMPIFSILFFIMCLANCGTPITFNFIGEFLSLYGIIERLSVIGILAASSIVLSAGYSIYLYNRICFGGYFSLYFKESINDLTKREFFILFSLVLFTVLFGIYPSFILDGLHQGVSGLIYSIYNSINSSINSELNVVYYGYGGGTLLTIISNGTGTGTGTVTLKFPLINNLDLARIKANNLGSSGVDILKANGLTLVGEPKKYFSEGMPLKDPLTTLNNLLHTKVKVNGDVKIFQFMPKSYNIFQFDHPFIPKGYNIFLSLCEIINHYPVCGLIPLFFVFCYSQKLGNFISPVLDVFFRSFSNIMYDLLRSIIQNTLGIFIPYIKSAMQNLGPSSYTNEERMHTLTGHSLYLLNWMQRVKNWYNSGSVGGSGGGDDGDRGKKPNFIPSDRLDLPEDQLRLILAALRNLVVNIIDNQVLYTHDPLSTIQLGVTINNLIYSDQPGAIWDFFLKANNKIPSSVQRNIASRFWGHSGLDAKPWTIYNNVSVIYELLQRLGNIRGFATESVRLYEILLNLYNVTSIDEISLSEIRLRSQAGQEDFHLGMIYRYLMDIRSRSRDIEHCIYDLELVIDYIEFLILSNKH